MKLSIIFITLLSLVLSSCFSTRNRRRLDASSNQDGFFGSTSSSGAESSSGSDSSSSSGGDIPQEFQGTNCNWASSGQSNYSYYHQHIGNYNYCQSTADERKVAFQIEHPIGDANICFIPTNSTGSTSVYIGEPKCYVVNQGGDILYITFDKNRPGYQTLNLTGSMVMKDKQFYYPVPFNSYQLSPDAYLYCMNWLSTTGDPSYCNAFTSVGEYLYHLFN